MTHRRSISIRSALAAAFIVSMVGCGGSAPAASTSSSATGAGSSSPPPSAGVPSPASGTASPSEAATTISPSSEPSLPAIFSSHADPALEDQLPSDVSGTSLQHYSQALSDVLDAGGDRAAIDAFLQAIGKTEADGSIAAAYDPTNTLVGGILAYKVTGADTAVLLEGIVSVEQSDLGDGVTKSQGTVGGKAVTILSVGTGVNDTEWIHGRGDVVFVVHAADEAHAAAFLQALP